MQEYVTQWVRLCASICAPDRVVWCEEPKGYEEVATTAPLTLVEVTPVSNGAIGQETILLYNLAELPMPVMEAKGMLLNRTMYVLPYCETENRVGVLVTDSPGVIAEYRRRCQGGDLWKLLHQSKTCLVTMKLVFPSCFVSFSLHQLETGCANPDCTTNTVVPPSLNFAMASNCQAAEEKDIFRPLFAVTCHRCKITDSRSTWGALPKLSDRTLPVCIGHQELVPL